MLKKTLLRSAHEVDECEHIVHSLLVINLHVNHQYSHIRRTRCDNLERPVDSGSGHQHLKTTTKAVMMLSLTLLPDAYSSSHRGASSIISPPAMMLRLVNFSNFESLEYVVLSKSTRCLVMSFARKSLVTCSLSQGSSRRPSGGLVRELMVIKSDAWLEFPWHLLCAGNHPSHQSTGF